MPDRALRRAGRRVVDLVEQHHHVVGRKQRHMVAPFALGCARELPRIKVDRGLRIGRVQMEMVKAGGREHGDESLPGMLRHYALGSEEINAWPGRLRPQIYRMAWNGRGRSGVAAEPAGV